MADLKSLAAEIEALPPHKRLHLAADLLERGQIELAHSVADRVVAELGAMVALKMLKKAGGGG